jgi:L-gulonate 3-dehydrogenase
MTRSVCLIGAGLIAQGWAILFANAGYRVHIHDPDSEAVAAAREAIRRNLVMLVEEGMIGSAPELSERISFLPTLKAAVADSSYVQESVTEKLEIKRAVFEELARMCGPEVILASSCSSIPPEDFMAGCSAPERCLIAHPFNPPHLVPLVELVVTRWTSLETLDRTRNLMLELGQRPVLVRRAVRGFVVNRLQAAVIHESLRLVADGVIDSSDLDLCMSQGLGLRWAFLGPFETMELNSAGGFRDYATKYGDIYRAILSDMGTGEAWNDASLDAVQRTRRDSPRDAQKMSARRLWRDRTLARLAKLLRGPHLGAVQTKSGGHQNSEPRI